MMFRQLIKFFLRVSVFKTVYFNFRMLKFRDAVKLPIFIYGKVKFYSLDGEVKIDEPVRTGMIHLGKDLDHNPVSLCPLKLNIQGSLVFHGNALISGGSTITVWKGSIELGRNVSIGSGVQVKAYTKISIGEGSQIVALSTIMDTDVHFLKNIQTGFIKNNCSPVYIGRFCWINQGSIISKGAVIPDYTIAARNTLLNKDYSKLDQGYSVYAGSPAKVVAKNLQRIFDNGTERKYIDYFSENTDLVDCQDLPGHFVEPEDTPHIFKF